MGCPSVRGVYQTKKKEFYKMKLNDAYYFMGTFKAVMVVMALILMIVGWCVKSYGYTLEMDYSGPGSEYERSMDHYRDQDNRDGWDRCQRDANEGRDSSRRDQDRADKYERDHGV